MFWKWIDFGFKNGKGLQKTAIIIFVLIFFRCDLPSSIGLDQVDVEPLDVLTIDTTTIEISTIVFDSVATSTNSRLLVGRYTDEYLGTVETAAVFQLGLDSIIDLRSNERPDEDDRYIDCQLCLKYDSYFYGDYENDFALFIAELEENMEPADDNLFYGHYTFNYDSLNALEYPVNPRPLDQIEISVPFPDGLCQELYDLVVADDDIMGNEEDFIEKYKGWIVKASSEATSVIGFSTGSLLQVNYEERGNEGSEEGGEEKELLFAIGDNYYYSQILRSDNNTPLDQLTESKQRLSSLDTDDISFIQGGVGYGLRVEMPFLKRYRELGEEVAIIDATLNLVVRSNSYDDKSYLPQRLFVGQVDKLNRIYNIPSWPSSIFLDEEFKETTTYLIGIEDFIRSQMDTIPTNQNALMFSSIEGEIGSTIEKLAINGEQGTFKSFVEINLLITKQGQ